VNAFCLSSIKDFLNALWFATLPAKLVKPNSRMDAQAAVGHPIGHWIMVPAHAMEASMKAMDLDLSHVQPVIKRAELVTVGLNFSV
jgi:hypothetical protein